VISPLISRFTREGKERPVQRNRSESSSSKVVEPLESRQLMSAVAAPTWVVDIDVNAPAGSEEALGGSDQTLNLKISDLGTTYNHKGLLFAKNIKIDTFASGLNKKPTLFASAGTDGFDTASAK